MYLACPRPQRDGTVVRKSMQIVGKKHADCVAKALLLHIKMIYKIQLIGNKQVTLFVKLNR